MVEEIINKESKLDILVNNFGTSTPSKDFDLIKTDKGFQGCTRGRRGCFAIRLQCIATKITKV